MGHLVKGIVNNVWSLKDVIKVKDLYAFCDAGHGEMFIGAVKVNGANNAWKWIKITVVVHAGDASEFCAGCDFGDCTTDFV